MMYDVECRNEKKIWNNYFYGNYQKPNFLKRKYFFYTFKKNYPKMSTVILILDKLRAYKKITSYVCCKG